jgi:ribosomal protein S27AE
MLAAALPHEPKHHQPAKREAKCPSCGERGWFLYGGEQQWPLKVAQALGIPTSSPLWHCGACHSTFTERDLK